MSSLEIQSEPSEMGLSPDRLERISAHFDAYVADRRLPSWQATVSRGGELVWTGKGGHRDRELDLPVTDDTIWRIYSMTKPLTTIAAMMLFEEGRFNLLDDVGTWIEALREPRVFVEGTPESHETRPASGPVRVHHLLSHTSGLTYGFNRLHPVDEIYRDKGYDFSWKNDSDLAQAVHDLCSSPLLFDPGTRWNYSVSTDVLGLLIEFWSGQPLDVFLRERILDPLGMDDTDWWCPEEKQDRLTNLYVPHQGDSFPYEDIAKYAKRKPRVHAGGGGLVSTARDYQRFATMLLNGGEYAGERFVSGRTLALMTENHLPDDADMKTLAFDSYAEDEYAGLGFGLGFYVVTDRRKNKSLATEGTYGWSGAASTLFWVDPAEDLTVGFFTQLLPSGTYPLRRELQQLVYQALVD
jgi:CubicO group peptidase (beta-lactamase class C family)